MSYDGVCVLGTHRGRSYYQYLTDGVNHQTTSNYAVLFPGQVKG